MKQFAPLPDSEFKVKLKRLILYRILFSTLLLGSTIVQQISDSPSPMAPPLLMLYGLIFAIFTFSPVYFLVLSRVKKYIAFSYAQIVIDTFFVTIILYVTGSFTSIFSFLYLVVIIYSSLLLPLRGTLTVAALCSIQYGVMVDLEFYGILSHFEGNASLLASTYPWHEVIYKILITMIACFAVAFLSGLLSEQARKSKRELRAMADHVKRVDKMAAIGELAAGLAHEIKNPLASLSGAIQFLQEDLHYDPDHGRLMHIILREADRLSSLVTNFLLYARPPAGKIEVVELDKALIETVELFEKDGSNSGRISTARSIQPGIWVAMDPVHVRQILWNLLLNAAESIDGNGNVEIAMYSQKNKHVCIKITDDGRGMSRETIKSIFDPFFTTKPSGTGLGLSIVQRIIEVYDARLDVDSEPGQGSSFSLRLSQLDPPTSS
jgi:two-component system sensor histidine kinase PilS (NtrC family)